LDMGSGACLAGGRSRQSLPGCGQRAVRCRGWRKCPGPGLRKSDRPQGWSTDSTGHRRLGDRALRDPIRAEGCAVAVTECDLLTKRSSDKRREEDWLMCKLLLVVS